MFRTVTIVGLAMLLSVAMLGCETNDNTVQVETPKAPTVTVKTPETPETPKVPQTPKVTVKTPEKPKAPTENIVLRIDPKLEKGLISPDTEVMVTLTVRNKTKGMLTMYWLDEIDGERVQYRDVEAGKELIQDTWEGHYWVIVDAEDKTLGIYKTPDKDGVIIVE